MEYSRNGVRDLMMICKPKRGFCEVQIAERRTQIEFAQTKVASLYEAFSPEEARAMARKLKFH